MAEPPERPEQQAVPALEDDRRGRDRDERQRIEPRLRAHRTGRGPTHGPPSTTAAAHAEDRCLVSTALELPVHLTVRVDPADAAAA